MFVMVVVGVVMRAVRHRFVLYKSSFWRGTCTVLGGCRGMWML